MTISNRIHSLRAATTATAAIALALAAIHTMTACSNDLDDIQQDMPQGVLQQGVSGDYVSVTLHLTTADLNGLAGSVSTRSAAGTATVSARPAAGEGSAQADADIICERVPAATATVTAATATTRTGTGINDPDVVANTAIKNLWVLQYDGTGDDAMLLTSVYINDYQNTPNIKLIATTTDCAIVFLANTYDNTLSFPINSTLATLKGQRFHTPGINTVVVKDPATATEGTETFPNDGDYYQRLNGMVTATVSAGTAINAQLQHNACRITVNVTNNTAGTTYPVTLTSASVENVPGCMYMLTAYDGYTSDEDAVGKPTDADILLYSQWDADDVITWTASEGTSATPKNAKLYLAPNESGVVTNNTSPKLKSLLAPPRATLLKLHGTYKDDTDDVPITYTFALGEDMINNYQLVPNGDYVYDITLNVRGDKTTDGRVSVGGSGVDYTDLNTWPLSNCYICNPPSTGTATFKIPVARVDQFWGGGSYESAQQLSRQ